MTLSIIKKGKQASAARGIVYGGDGIGKSTFAASSTQPVFLDVEGGLGNLDVDRIDLVDGKFNDVVNALRLLYKEDHTYQTVVIDSLDWLERKILTHVCEDKKVDSIESLPYGKGWVFALNQWADVISALDYLRKDKGMEVILIAHAKVRQVSDPTVSAFSRWDLQLNDKASAVLKQWADWVGFAGYETIVTSKSGEFGRTQVRATSTGERWLNLVEEPAFDAKNRFGITERLPLDYSELKKFIKG